MDTANTTIKTEPVDSDEAAEIYIKKEVDMDYKGDNIVIKEEEMELDDPETERCAPYYNYQSFNLSCIKNEYSASDDSYNAIQDAENLLPSPTDIKPDLEKIFLEQLKKNNYITSEDTDESQVKVECEDKIESPVKDFEQLGFKRIRLKRLFENEPNLENEELVKVKVKEEDSETGYESSSPQTRKTVVDTSNLIDIKNCLVESTDKKNAVRTIFLQKSPSASVVPAIAVGQNNNNKFEVSQNPNLNISLKNIGTSSQQTKFPVIVKIPNEKLSLVNPKVFVTPQSSQHNGLKLLKNNFNGLKLVKLAPNSRIVKIPNICVPQFNTSVPTQNSNPQKKKFFINFNPVLSMNSVANQTSSTSGSVPNLITNTKDNRSVNENNTMEIQNSPIVIESDSDDESKLNVDDKLNIQKSFLNLSENEMENNMLQQIKELGYTDDNLGVHLQENKVANTEVINTMIQQIKEVENQMNCVGVTSLVQDSTGPKATVNKNQYKSNLSVLPIGSNGVTTIQNAEYSQNKPPEVFFLPVKSKYDPELIQAKREFKNYRFAWLCPHCPREYEQKHAFRGHLVSSHGLCKEEFDQLLVEVKSYDTHKKTVDVDRFKKLMKQRAENQAPNDETPIEITENGDLPEKQRKKKYRNIQHICNKCGRHCSSKTMLNDHIASNCSREPQYPCPECPKKFFSYSTLTCHITIHTGELPFKCDFCDKKFRTRGQVTVHHRTHTGERPFECQVCSQSFTHRETLISHLSRHIGMKRYKCYGCNKQFSCISGLKMHREIRPDTCGKVKFNPRALGPRVRVVRGNIIFEPQPEINPYLRSDDPDELVKTSTTHHEDQIFTQ
ncbi:protein suppressor of hairy wing [Teleopsis dalmanni]|uniref:protein suppressor of hairy wing n=1 Tax=Teleopsis dalmanni TaxID=139649 RepID=UPI0018CEBDB6|nr:protein suppressor of hairy wing [Teleopsis dalmanni]